MNTSAKSIGIKRPKTYVRPALVVKGDIASMTQVPPLSVLDQVCSGPAGRRNPHCDNGAYS